MPLFRPLPELVRVLIVDEMHPSLLPMLAEIGVEADYQPAITAAAIPAALVGYHGLVVRSKLFISAAVLAAAPDLLFICRAGAGVDNIDEAALQAAGVELFNAPEGNRDAVGEFTVGLLLGLLRHIPRADAQVRQQQWHRELNRGTELGALTVGIVGYGHMGASFARCLSGFGCEVLATDILPEKVTDGYAQYVSVEELHARADVISLHVPLTPLTRRMINADWLNACMRPVWLLNTARGEVLDTAALVAALASGRVRGAALDVLDNERLATLSPEQAMAFAALCAHPQVILTPHIGGWTTNSYERINQVLVKKLVYWLAQMRVA